MCAKTSGGQWRKLAGGAACALALAATSVRAESTPDHDLEKAFWTCDYVATTRGVYAAPVAVCTAVTEELKIAKFSGDFVEMLRWWRENKPAEHRKLAAADR